MLASIYGYETLVAGGEVRKMSALNYFKNVTRGIRVKLVQILSPSLWARANIGAMPRGSTRFAVEYFREKPITYCEVGVDKGENVVDVMNRLNVQHSYLIDIYEEYQEDDPIQNKKILLRTHQDQNEAFKIAKENLESYRVIWILKYSDKAVEDVPDNIEFIYIDANHDYEYVKKDLELYWEKVSVNGILAGHDFMADFNGVINAVSEFASENQLHIYSHKYDWWFIKENRF